MTCVASCGREDTFVDFEHSLNAAVKRLREALGDSATAPRFIQTIPRRGYRFIATVEMIDSPPPVEQSPVLSESVKKTSRPISHRWQAYGGALLFVALVVYLVSQAFPRESPLEIRSIAVLPLVNLSGDASKEYFADGMTESLINALRPDSSAQDRFTNVRHEIQGCQSANF